MKTLLCTVLFSAALGVVLSAPSDVDVRASNCVFDPNKLELCKEKDQKIPIPCEQYCDKFYVCDENLRASLDKCGFWKKFNATTLECTATVVDCKWYETEVTVPPPTGSSFQPPASTNSPTLPTTTEKSGAASATSAAFLISGAAIAAIARGYL